MLVLGTILYTFSAKTHRCVRTDEDNFANYERMRNTKMEKKIQ
jgi:hypothetical protein